MGPALLRLYSLLPREARRSGLLLLVMMVIGAALEVVGIAAIPVFVGVMISSEELSVIPVVGEALQSLGRRAPGEMVVWAAAALIAIYAFKNGFLVFNYLCQTRYVTRRRNELGCRLTNAYMTAPYSFHVSRNTSELLRNIDREVNIIAYQVLAAVLEICTRALVMVAVLAFLFVIEPWITLFWLMIFGTLGAICVKSVSGRLKRAGLAEQAQRKHFVQLLYQGFGSIKESRVLNREHFFARKINDSIRFMSDVYSVKLFTGKAVSPVMEFLAVTGVLVLAAALVALGRPTESILMTLSLFVVGLVRLRETISSLMTHMSGLRYNYVSVLPVHADLARLEDVSAGARSAAATEPPAARPLEHAIELRDVWYRYDDADGYALHGINLTIPVGSAIGFIGSTGAGKSTVIDILLGLIEPQNGAVLVDGVDIRSGEGIGPWQTAIGYVPQSIYLLDDTIRRNIALGLDDDKIDEVALWAAIRTAHLDEFVQRQPAGLETSIGENGVRLSGGERQRIGIARALYHDPKVLVLDEATSALDNVTEREVVKAVEALKGQRTVIIIAHRLSTVKNCDRLYFLKQGRVVAEGSYSDLESSHPDFRLMAAE
ncbi:MAG: ABC transporter ATP-binding protein [Rhodospirillaceae bacterium]